MIVVCESDITAPGMWALFPDHLLNGGSHFEEVDWVQNYVSLGVRAVFKPQRTTSSLLVQVKEKIPAENQREVVYEVPCKDYGLKCIGETRRNLKTRMTEHKGAVHRGDERNGIAVHVHQLQHGIDWESARVRMTARRYWNRRTLEAIQIRRKHHTMNLDCGFPV